MIDKIELVYDDPEIPLSLWDIEQTCRANGLTLEPVPNMRERGYFVRVAQHPSIYFRIRPDRHIERMYANPSHFPTWQDFLRVMQSLDRIRGGGLTDALCSHWLEVCTVARIDYAIRYRRRFDDVRYGLDVQWRQQRREIQSTGRSITGLYFGAHPDIVSIYDESTFYLLRRGRRRIQQLTNAAIAEEIETGVPITKIERQIRQASKVGTFAQHRLHLGRHLRFNVLEEHIRDVANGLIRPFERLVVQETTIMTASELRNRGQQQRADQLRGALQMSSFGDVRRRFNHNRNFDRLYRPLLRQTPLPPNEQPENMLQSSLRQYLGMPLEEPQNDNTQTTQARPRQRRPNAPPPHPRRRPSQT